MLNFTIIMHEIQFRLAIRPKPAMEIFSAPLYSLAIVGEGKGGMEGTERKGRGQEKMDGMG